jgi:hypothetical protein
MSINPIHFAHSACEEFLRYIFSAFPLADPDLAGQARSKSADWQERGSEHIATVPAEVIDEVRAKLKPLLGM